MNELEELLREDLRAATDWLPDDVDSDALLSVGRRLRRSRVVSRTVLAAAAVVVVGLVGSAAWRSLPPVPTAPSPLQTVSAVPSEPATPSDPLSTTFDLHDQGLGRNAPIVESIRVAVEPAGQEVGVRVTVAYGGKAPVERRFTVQSGAAWRVAWDQHLLIGILPGETSWFTITDSSDKGVYSGDAQPLDGIGSSAFWSYFEESGGPGSVNGVIWQAKGGAVQDSRGNAVPSATVTLSNDTYLVYKDVALDQLGIRPARGGGAYSTAIGKVTDFLHGSLGYKSTGDWVWSQYGVLPEGSRDVQLELAGKDGEWASAQMTDGSIAVVATLRSKSDSAGNLVRSISYTDASGKRVTHTR